MITENKLAFIIVISILTLNASTSGQNGLSVHGYLNQAFAISSNHQIHGIPTDGTTDYRNLALQFRYDTDEKNNVVIQFSHERLGLSPIMEWEEDVELDWAYFEHKFNDKFSIKLGKIQLPFGIFNEIRDVGTLIPFFRIPISPYGEGSYMSEAVDGLVLKYSGELYDNWALETKLFFGRWDWLERINLPNPLSDDFIVNSKKANVEKAVGVHMWMNTPIEGIAFGGGILKGHVSGGLSFRENYLGDQNFNIAHISFDGNLDPLLIRSEFLYYWMDDHSQNIRSYYVQIGYNVLDNFSVNMQIEYAGVFDNVVPVEKQFVFGAAKGDFDHYKNHGFGLKYDLFTYLTCKIEYHFFSGFAIEDKFVRFLIDKPYKTQYSIFSIATAFE